MNPGYRRSIAGTKAPIKTLESLRALPTSLGDRVFQGECSRVWLGGADTGADWYLMARCFDASRGKYMARTKLHDPLTEALECIKAGGLIRKYSLIWRDRSDAPRIVVWKASDRSDEELRRSIADGLAGLAAESQVAVAKD